MGRHMLNICRCRYGLIFAGLAICLSSGCRWIFREHHCPTDLRHTYCICENEAVRRCPCGPDAIDFGVKQTTWRCGPSGWHPPSPCPCMGGCESCELGPHMMLPETELIPTPESAPPSSLLPAPNGSHAATDKAPIKPLQFNKPEYPPNPFVK